MYFLCHSWFLLHHPLVNIYITLDISIWEMSGTEGQRVSPSEYGQCDGPTALRPNPVPTKHDVGSPAEGWTNSQNGIRAKTTSILFLSTKHRANSSFSIAALTTVWPKPVCIYACQAAAAVAGLTFHSMVLFTCRSISEHHSFQGTCQRSEWVVGIKRIRKHPKFLLD